SWNCGPGDGERPTRCSPPTTGAASVMAEHRGPRVTAASSAATRNGRNGWKSGIAAPTLVVVLGPPHEAPLAPGEQHHGHQRHEAVEGVERRDPLDGIDHVPVHHEVGGHEGGADDVQRITNALLYLRPVRPAHVFSRLAHGWPPTAWAAIRNHGC